MRILMTAMLVSLPVWGQTASGPEFEAASVKPSPTPGISILIPANAKLMGRCLSLMRLISFAYNLPYTRIAGPSWLDSDAFEIQAKGKAGLKDADIRLMAQALLAQRFGLQCHRETKEAKMYFLVQGDGRPKIVPANEPTPHNPTLPQSPHSTMGGDVTMEELAVQLSRGIGVTVLDRTGIDGKYHCYLWWGRNPDTDPDVFQAVKEQLGLKLQAGKSDVEFLVIDRINRTATEN